MSVNNPPRVLPLQIAIRPVSPINNPRYSTIFDEATTNLVTNPSFEVNTTGWTASGANASISRVTAQKSVGDASMQVVVSPAATGQGVELAAVTVSPSTAYVFSVDLKGNAGGEVVFIQAAFDVGGTVNGGAYVLSTGWNRTRLAVTSPIGSSTVTLRVLTSGVITATFFVDAAQLEQKPFMTSYCDGSLGLGYAWTGTAHASTSTRAAGFNFLAPIAAGSQSRFGIRADGSIGASQMIFRADENMGNIFTSYAPFTFIGHMTGFTTIGTQGSVMRVENTDNGPALWVKSATTNDVGMVIESPNITSGIMFALAVPSDLNAFTGEYLSFTTKAGLRQYQLSKVRLAMGTVADALQKRVEGWGGGKYTTTLQSNFTGTVAVSAASPTVTGTGTTFLTQYQIDDTIVIDTGATAVKRRVTAIASNTSLTANANYTAPLSGVTHTQPVTQYLPFGIMFESAGGDHANLAQGDYQNYLWFNRADRPKMLRGSAVSTLVVPTADTDGLYITHELARTSAQVAIASTAVETAAFTATIPANRLGTTGTLRLHVVGRFLYNNNAANTIRLRAKYGATTLVDSTALVVPGGTSATRRAFAWETLLTNVAATNSQKMFSRMTASQDTTSIANALGLTWHGYGTSAIDSQVDQSLTLTVEWGTSSANNSFEVEFATLEAV